MKAISASLDTKEVFPIKMGEEADFQRTFLLYHAPLRYYCEQLTGADDECEDIVSQLFLTLWNKQTCFESKEHAQAYLYRSAKNACLNFIRDSKLAGERKNNLDAEIPSDSINYLDAFVKTEVWAELYRAIECLPSQCCKVINMSYIDGMSNQEIADELELSLQTVKNYKQRGLSLLKNKLPEGLFILLLSAHILK